VPRRYKESQTAGLSNDSPPSGRANTGAAAETLEDALADGRFAAEADDLRLYRRIATMDTTAPLPPLDDQTPTWSRAASLAREWELNRLAERLDELSSSPR
jgi:hypothetical protein